MRTAETLISLGGHPGWFESLLGAHWNHCVSFVVLRLSSSVGDTFGTESSVTWNIICGVSRVNSAQSNHVLRCSFYERQRTKCFFKQTAKTPGSIFTGCKCHFVGFPVLRWANFHKWAASCQNQHNGMCAQRGLRSAWASAQSDQSSLCAQWVAMGPRFFHAESEDTDQTGRMPRLIWVFARRTVILLFCHEAAQIESTAINRHKSSFDLNPKIIKFLFVQISSHGLN